MPSLLHLVSADAGPLAAPVIERTAGEPDTAVTVVLLDGAGAPTLPPTVRVLRLGSGGLDYAALLDLIFASDRVIAW
jgi:hypothetical protein